MRISRHFENIVKQKLAAMRLTKSRISHEWNAAENTNILHTKTPPGDTGRRNQNTRIGLDFGGKQSYRHKMALPLIAEKSRQEQRYLREQNQQGKHNDQNGDELPHFTDDCR